MYFSHEDNKNLVDIKDYYYHSQVDTSMREKIKIRVEDGEYYSTIILDNIDNEINFAHQQKYITKIINYNPDQINYQLTSSDYNCLDCYLDIKTGLIILYAVNPGKATLIINGFDKQLGYRYHKEINVNIAKNIDQKLIVTDYDPGLYRDYLDRLISGFEFLDEGGEEEFNFNIVEDNIKFDKNGISYKGGWHLNYDRYVPEANRNYYEIPQSFLIRREYDIDQYSTKDQSVIDPFIIEDLQNNLNRDDFSDKYLLKPKIVKIKRVLVESDEQKAQLLAELKETLDSNDVNNRYIKRITGLRYKELVNEISKRQTQAINTYGSVMFEKIAQAIKDDLKIYQQR